MIRLKFYAKLHRYTRKSILAPTLGYRLVFLTVHFPVFDTAIKNASLRLIIYYINCMIYYIKIRYITWFVEKSWTSVINLSGRRLGVFINTYYQDNHEDES